MPFDGQIVFFKFLGLIFLETQPWSYSFSFNLKYSTQKIPLTLRIAKSYTPKALKFKSYPQSYLSTSF